MRCDAITSSRRRRKFKTDQKESQTQNENESQRVGQQSGSGSGSSTSLDKEEEDERTNCSSARMEKLEFKCRSVVRQCILSLLTTSLSMKDFQDIEDDLLKAICSYLNCDKFWTDITRDSQSRSIPLAICILIGILLIGGFSVCYYIVWTLFEGPLNFGGETSVVNVTRREGNRETSNGLKLVPASQQKQQQQQQQQQHQNGNHKQQQQHHIVRSASTGPGSTPSRPSNLIIHPKMPYRSRPKILITSPSVRRSPLARSMSSQSGHHFYRHQEQSRLRQEQQQQQQHQSIQRSLPLSSSGSSGYLPLRRSRYTSPIEASLSEEVTKPESCPDVQLALVSRRKEVDSRKTPSSILSLTTPLREPIPPSHMHHHNSSGQIVYHSSRDHYYYYHEPSSRHTRGHSYQNHPSSSPLSSSSPPSSGSTQPKRGGQFVAILGSESADNTSRTPSKEEPRSTQSTPV